MGQSSQCHGSPRQVNAPVMRAGQSPRLVSREHCLPPRHKLATVNEASLQLADPGQWRKHASSLLLALGARLQHPTDPGDKDHEKR